MRYSLTGMVGIQVRFAAMEESCKKEGATTRKFVVSKEKMVFKWMLVQRKGAGGIQEGL